MKNFIFEKVKISKMMIEYSFQQVTYKSRLYKEVVSLREDILRKPLGLRFSPEDLETDAAEFIFAFISGNLPIACVQAKPIDNQMVKLRQMAVAVTWQRKGLGSALLSRVENELKRKGFEKVILHARAYALPFYQKAGYHIVSELFIEVGLPHFKMLKTL